MTSVLNGSFRWEIWSLSKFSRMCSPLWPSVPTRSLLSSSLGHTVYTARVGSVAYRLELPASSSIHPVFHVKKAASARHSVTAVPPSEDVLWSVPERIIQRRNNTKGTHSIQQGLIKWSNLPVSRYVGGFGVPASTVLSRQHLELSRRARKGGCYASRLYCSASDN